MKIILCVFILLFSFQSFAKTELHQTKLEHQTFKYKKSEHHIKYVLFSNNDKVKYIKNQLKQHHLPIDFFIVPLIESSYQQFATSKAKAKGYWQLIKKTALRFGLTVNNRQDQRTDFKKSTHGAIQYLSYLYQLFNKDVYLALASYNAGEQRVLNAIKSNPNYQSIDDLNLPNETTEYVYRYQALVNLLDSENTYQGDDEKSQSNESPIQKKPIQNSMLIDFNQKNSMMVL